MILYDIIWYYMIVSLCNMDTTYVLFWMLWCHDVDSDPRGWCRQPLFVAFHFYPRRHRGAMDDFHGAANVLRFSQIQIQQPVSILRLNQLESFHFVSLRFSSAVAVPHSEVLWKPESFASQFKSANLILAISSNFSTVMVPIMSVPDHRSWLAIRCSSVLQL